MAAFPLTHPVLLNNWIMEREMALARVRAVAALTPAQIARLGELAQRVAAHLEEWNLADPVHQARIAALRAEWGVVSTALQPSFLAQSQPLEAVMQHVSGMGEDMQELMVALLIEPFGDLVDGWHLAWLTAYSTFAPPLRDTDALGVDYAAPDHCGQFWYLSAAKMEPCLGLRFTEESALLETSLDIARRVAAAYADLPAGTEAVSAFLTRHPDYALMVERIKLSAWYPYAEIQDNFIAQSCLPLDMLRGKLGRLDADHPVSGRDFGVWVGRVR